MVSKNIPCSSVVRMVLSVLVASGVCIAARVQDEAPVLFERMPGDVGPVIAALGRRVQSPGRERTVYAGQFRSAEGNRDGVIEHQLPGRIRLEGLLPGSAVAGFDGHRIFGAAGPAADALIETFVQDLAEGMLSSVRQGAAVRLLGRAFKPAGRAAPAAGNGYDIYEIAAPVPGRLDQMRLKRYYFDAKTGLLESTRYSGAGMNPAVNVEARFSNWARVEDSAYPGRIDRFEDGRLVFSFIVASVTPGPGSASR